MARLIVIVPLVLLVALKLFTWWAKRRTAQLEVKVARAQETIARHEERVRQADLRTIIPAHHGLVHGDELLIGGEQPIGAAAALAAARAGDWGPAAVYLAAPSSGWDGRWHRLGPFRELAVEEDDWLRAWRKEQPENPDAALLHTVALTGVAWQVRSGRLGSEITREQAEGFHRVLREAEQAAWDGIDLAHPDDPNPWVALIPIAKGLGWPHQRFRSVWAEITERDPNHWGAHDAALQYWCEKWRGSHELMHAFADTAFDDAPAGSLLGVLKLQAHYEQIARARAPRSAYESPEVGAVLDAALADLAAADPEHHRVPDVRGWLGYVLTRAGRHAEAVDQFRALGRTVPAPWTLYDNPVRALTDDRIDAVIGADPTALVRPS